jgi:ABC-type uncharacterized transport system permease subunit
VRGVDALSERSLFVLALAVYGLAAAHGALLWRRGFPKGEWTNYGLLCGGFVLHSLAMIGRGFSLARCPVTNLFEALMFVLWAIAMAYLVGGLWAPLRFLGVFLAPVLVGVGLFALQPGLDRPGPVFDLEHAAVSLHVALVLLAYAGFGFACVTGILYLIREHDGGSERFRALAGNLPPLARLEQVLLRSLGIGLILLTAGLVGSFGLMRERYGVVVRPDAKIAWSILVWMVYLGLLVQRLKFRHQARRLAWGSMCGFAFVILTFWGTNLLSPIHQ